MKGQTSLLPAQFESDSPLRMLSYGALRCIKNPWGYFAFAVLVVILDFASGPSINLSLLFLVPVVAAVWRQGLPSAAAYIVALPLCRLWFEWNWGAPWAPGDAVGNCFVRVLALAGFAVMNCRLARAESRLRESERLYQSLVENIPQGIFRKDVARRFTFANRRFCQQFSKSPTEVVGLLDEDLFPHDVSAKYQKDDRRIIESGRNLESVEERRPLQGKPTYTHVIKTPLRDEENRIVGIQGIYWDITEQRLLHDQLRQAQKMEAVGQLASGVAHNFNNVLAAMMMTVELVLIHNRLEPSIRAMLQSVKEGIERAARLTRQLLLVSRPSPIQMEVLDLNKSVEKMLALLRQTICGQITVQFNPTQGPLEVEADESMIDQVIQNLVDNACDAMPHGGVLNICTSQCIRGADAPKGMPEARIGQFAMLEISDTGCGMDRATLERIFEPFFTTKEVGRGTGLGLSMVHGIVKHHNGWVEVESQPHIGSVFRVQLPVSHGARQEETEIPAIAPVL